MQTKVTGTLAWLVGGVALAVLVGGIGIATAMTPQQAAVLSSIAPCRLVDTRPDPFNVGGRDTPLGPEEELVLDVHGENGNCTIPSGATAITANVTIVNPSADSFLSMWPSDGTNPGTSVLNWVAGQAPTPNALTVALSDVGQVSVFNQFGTVDVVIDVTGFFSDHDHDDRYYTKSQIDAELATIPALDAYTKAEVDAALGDKADAADVYTKAEVDGLVPSASYVVTDDFDCNIGGGNCLGGTYTAPLAACSPGDIVTGGAATRTSATSSFVPQDHMSFPAGGATPTGWTTTDELNVGDRNVITVYAICLDITP